MTSKSEVTSRTAHDGGTVTQSGSRGAGTQYYPHTEIVRMPSGSIAQIPALKPIDLNKARFNEALMLALLFNGLLWFGLFLIVRELFF